MIHLEFYKNGTFAFVHPGGNKVYSAFTVSGDQLLIGSVQAGKPVIRKTAEVSLDFVADLTGVRYAPGGIDGIAMPRRFTLTDPDSLSVWDSGRSAPRKLTRLPE